MISNTTWFGSKRKWFVRVSGPRQLDAAASGAHSYVTSGEWGLFLFSRIRHFSF